MGKLHGHSPEPLFSLGHCKGICRRCQRPPFSAATKFHTSRGHRLRQRIIWFPACDSPRLFVVPRGEDGKRKPRAMRQNWRQIYTGSYKEAPSFLRGSLCMEWFFWRSGFQYLCVLWPLKLTASLQRPSRRKENSIDFSIYKRKLI